MKISAREYSKITKINGQTAPNELVTAFRVFNQSCNFFPQQISKFFPNIEAIAIQNSKLKDLTRNDLKSFPKLKSLSLFGNELRTLEFGIFDGNLKLEMLSIYDNKIEAIGSEILEPLKGLKKAFFSLERLREFRCEK